MPAAAPAASPPPTPCQCWPRCSNAKALDRLEAFTSLNGPAFYGLPVNEGTVTLTKGAPVDYPAKIAVEGGDAVTVFQPGFPLHWSVSE